MSWKDYYKYGKTGLRTAGDITTLIDPNAPVAYKIRAGSDLGRLGGGLLGNTQIGSGAGIVGDIAGIVGPGSVKSKVKSGVGLASDTATLANASSGVMSAIKTVAPIAAGAMSIYDMASHGPNPVNVGGLLSAGLAFAGAGPWALVPAGIGILGSALGLFGDGTERVHLEREHTYSYDPSTQEWKLDTNTTRREKGKPVKVKDVEKVDDDMFNHLGIILDQTTDQFEEIAPGFKEYIAKNPLKAKSYWGVEDKHDFKKHSKQNVREWSLHVLTPLGHKFNEYLKKHPEYKEKFVPLRAKDFTGYINPETGIVLDKWYGVQGQVNPEDGKFYSINWYLEPKDFSNADIEIENQLQQKKEPVKIKQTEPKKKVKPKQDDNVIFLTNNAPHDVYRFGGVLGGVA